MSDAIFRNEEGNFVVTAPDGHEVEVRPALTKPTVRFKNVKRPATRLVEFIDGGHQGRINVTDFDPAIHRDPLAEPAPAPARAPAPAPAPIGTAPVETPDPSDVEPFDFRELDLTSLVAVLADAPADQVDEIEAYEKDNKGRKTVLKAAAARREALSKE